MRLIDITELEGKEAIIIGRTGKRMALVTTDEGKTYLYREVGLNKYQRVQEFRGVYQDRK